MRQCEGIPSDHPTVGVFIGNLLIRNHGAFAGALTEDLLADTPIDERPIDNPELCRTLSQEVACASEEGPDLDERRMVVFRGIYWAYSITKQITSPKRWPELRETPDGTALEPDTRALTIMQNAFQVCRNFNCTAGIARDCSPFVDPSGNYFKLSHLSVIAGFYLIDNGERQRQRREEDNARSLQQARDDIAFAKLKAAEEEKQRNADLATFATLTTELSIEAPFNRLTMPAALPPYEADEFRFPHAS